MTDREAALTVVNATLEIDRAVAWLEGFAVLAGLPHDVTSKLQVVLDELLSNIIGHALAEAVPAGRDIGLELRTRRGHVELEISDDGAPFDPNSMMEVAPPQRVEPRRVGGVGLIFVRALMDDVCFARRDGRNHVLLRKRLPEAAG